MVGAPTTNSVYVCNLPPGTDENLLAEHFGTIGVLKKDKRSGRPKIWIYRDKSTNAPKGDATVTYEDPYAASAAVEWFSNKDFHGNIISVYIAETKSKEIVEPVTAGEGLSLPGYDVDPSSTEAVAGGIDNNWATGDAGGGRGPGDQGGKTWQQEGDWLCPNPSCTNVNFAFRGVCNRCGTARPAGTGGGFGGGRGRGRRGGSDGGDRGRGPGGPPGLFGPNDWACPMCENINWAKRTKCNICNTTKPGLNEGGVREGRAGGYKELDEAELEETKRRRREAEEDDGEMYDEFGNLKKKFRVKAKQGETVVGGKAGWANEDLGVVEHEKGREKVNERSREAGWRSKSDYGQDGYHSSHYDEYSVHKDDVHDRNKGRDHRDQHDYHRERSSEASRDTYRERESRDRDRNRDRDRDPYRERDRDRDRNRDRERGRARERERFRETDRDR